MVRGQANAEVGLQITTAWFSSVGWKVCQDLWVYTDASIPDQPKPVRGKPPPVTRAAPAYVAWYGWDDALAFSNNPCFLGEAYVGVRGPQKAEFLACVHGLAAALGYLSPFNPQRRPARVILRTDSREVHRQLRGEAKADILAPYVRTANLLVESLTGLGLAFRVEQVSAKHDKPMKAVHGRSREAIRVRGRQGGWPCPPDAIPF